jgi:hypothetical protein
MSFEHDNMVFPTELFHLLAAALFKFLLGNGNGNRVSSLNEIPIYLMCCDKKEGIYCKPKFQGNCFRRRLGKKKCDHLLILKRFVVRPSIYNAINNDDAIIIVQWLGEIRNIFTPSNNWTGLYIV